MNTLERKPDAGKPHVRFDERGVETECMTGYSGTGNRKGRIPLRPGLNATAPLLDSTKWSAAVSKTNRSARNELNPLGFCGLLRLVEDDTAALRILKTPSHAPLGALAG